MMLTSDELVTLLRKSINVQIPTEDEDTVIDPAYLVMTDEDIKLFIKLGASRVNPEATSLEDLEEGSEYPIIFLAKYELYTRLAVERADKVNISADGASLSLDQRFQHYMELAKDSMRAYENWLENEGNGGNGTVSTYDVLLSRNHYTKRNVEKQAEPKVKVKVDEVTQDSVAFSWKVSKISHFGRFKVYISKTPIVDPYKEGFTFESKLNEGATLIKSTMNIRETMHRIGGLESGTKYYIAVISVERNQVYGYSEINFTTEVPEEEVSVETLEV